MQWQLATISLPPLLAFVVLRRPAGDRGALIGAIVVAGLEWAYDSFQLGFVEPFSLASFALFGLLGGLSIRRGDLIFFKLQPVAFQCILAGTFLYYNWVRGEPLFATIVQEHMGLADALPTWRRGYLEVYTVTLSKSIPFVLLAHAGWTAWAAVHSTFWRWLAVRVLGLYLAILLVFLAERLLPVPY